MRKYILVILDDFDMHSSKPEHIESAICTILELVTENYSTQIFNDSLESKLELVELVSEEL